MPASLKAQAYLAAFQEDMQPHFHLVPQAEYQDRTFPLYAVLQIEETSTLLFRNGKSAISYEFCYFDACDTFDAAQLAYYCGILEDMAARYIWKIRLCFLTSGYWKQSRNTKWNFAFGITEKSCILISWIQKAKIRIKRKRI